MSFTVLFRAGGSRTAKQESFDDETAAERFRDLVNGHGRQWPPGWIRGREFVSDLRSPEEMFEPFAMKQINFLTGVQGDTKATYRRLVEQNMSPWFKSHSVRDGEGGITREMVQQWINDLSAGVPAPHDAKDRKLRTKYRPKTVANQHGLLHAILQAAVDAEPQLRATNPCICTRLPRLDGEEVEEEMVFLEREEWVWIQECLAEDAKELAETFAGTGARWGEVTALQPRDLRRRNGRPAVRIQRAWKRDEDGKPYMGAPKTKKSRRTIVITHKLDRMLRRRARGKAPDDMSHTGRTGHAGFRRVCTSLALAERIEQRKQGSGRWPTASNPLVVVEVHVDAGVVRLEGAAGAGSRGDRSRRPIAGAGPSWWPSQVLAVSPLGMSEAPAAGPAGHSTPSAGGCRVRDGRTAEKYAFEPNERCAASKPGSPRPPADHRTTKISREVRRLVNSPDPWPMAGWCGGTASR